MFRIPAPELSLVESDRTAEVLQSPVHPYKTAFTCLVANTQSACCIVCPAIDDVSLYQLLSAACSSEFVSNLRCFNSISLCHKNTDR